MYTGVNDKSVVVPLIGMVARKQCLEIRIAADNIFTVEFNDYHIPSCFRTDHIVKAEQRGFCNFKGRCNGGLCVVCTLVCADDVVIFDCPGVFNIIIGEVESSAFNIECPVKVGYFTAACDGDSAVVVNMSNLCSLSADGEVDKLADGNINRLVFCNALVDCEIECKESSFARHARFGAENAQADTACNGS